MKYQRSLLLRWLAVGVCVASLAAVANAARPVKEIATDLAKVTAELNRYGGTSNLVNPIYRRQMQQVAIPLLKKRVELLREIQAADPVYKDAAGLQQEMDLAICAVIGDAEARQSLERDAAGADAWAAESARLAIEMRNWWTDPTIDGQQKVLARLTAAAKAHPTDDALAHTLLILSDSAPASSALGHAAAMVVVDQMKGPFATQYRLTPNKPGFPLEIAGNTVDGRSFTSAQWKGKVVMVCFWGTFSAPCRAELPQVVAIYNKYHDQGFEIIGVSNDPQKPELVKFLGEHPELKWPQLFGPSDSPSHWNALSERFKVTAIPTMYLIDRNGILRSTTARGRLDEIIPRLLQEKLEATLQTAEKPPAGDTLATTAKATAGPTDAPAAGNPAAGDGDAAEKAAHALSLARSYVAVRRYDTARVRLKKIIDTYPTTPAARQARDLLQQIEGD